MKKLSLVAKIGIGMLLGVVIGVIAIFFEGNEFVLNWIKPFGTIFVSMLKLIAIPLILVSLIDGISNMTDTSKLSRIGGKTMGLYLTTTVLAIAFALLIANVVNPGSYLPDEKRMELKEKFAKDAMIKQDKASDVKESRPL